MTTHEIEIKELKEIAQARYEQIDFLQSAMADPELDLLEKFILMSCVAFLDQQGNTVGSKELWKQLTGCEEEAIEAAVANLEFFGFFKLEPMTFKLYKMYDERAYPEGGIEAGVRLGLLDREKIAVQAQKDPSGGHTT